MLRRVKVSPPPTPPSPFAATDPASAGLNSLTADLWNDLDKFDMKEIFEGNNPFGHCQ